jgi:hypothetical protein
VFCGNCFFKGVLDDMGVWNRSLTQQEITNMYNGVNYSDTCNAVSGSLVNGLVAYYPFCGNANDQSGSGLNGVVNGATLTIDRFGNSNNAYSFNGTSNYIEVQDNNLLDLTNNYTISAWIKINEFCNQTDLNSSIIKKERLIGGTGYGLGISSNGGIVDEFNNTSSNAPVYTNSVINASVWAQIISVHDGSTRKIYFNGNLIDTQAFNNSLIVSSQNLFIGKEFSGNIGGGGYTNRYFNGIIDDIGIWNRALTQQEITQLFNQNQCTTNITVTDTLIINVGQLSYTNPVAYANNITLYPNPANTQVNISFNNISDLTGGNINIINSLGQQVATTPITLSGTNTTMPLNTWGGTGLYFVQIINAQGIVVDVKKIILQ